MFGTPEVKLGWLVKDVLTGFVGYAISRIEYLNDKPQVFLQPAVMEKNELKEGHWFPEERLEGPITG